MAQRLIIFQVEDLRNLLIHYYDGKEVPLNSEIVEVGVSKLLQRLVSLTIASPEWSDQRVNKVSGELQPTQLFYEGKRTMSWTDQYDEGKWSEPGAVEAPKRQ